jgi:hypothetical protein
LDFPGTVRARGLNSKMEAFLWSTVKQNENLINEPTALENQLHWKQLSALKYTCVLNRPSSRSIHAAAMKKISNPQPWRLSRSLQRDLIDQSESKLWDSLSAIKRRIDSICNNVSSGFAGIFSSLRTYTFSNRFSISINKMQRQTSKYLAERSK